MKAPQKGDFVSTTSYQPISRTANFTSYTSASFSEEDQARLADTVRVLADRGLHVNSDTPLIQSLYKDFESTSLWLRGSSLGKPPTVALFEK